MLVQILKGLGSWLPGGNRVSSLRRRDAERTARYYYSCWLRHLVLAEQNGLHVPAETVAELGPGHCLGMGLCALLSGTSHYFGLDVVHYTDLESNLPMFEELVGLFRDREAIPPEEVFPNLRPRLESYEFPGRVLPDHLLDASLSGERIDGIRRILRGGQGGNDSGISISYFAPWSDPATLRENSVDLIFSQAVLEHVDDLRDTYNDLFMWLKPSGCMTHLIDFKSHGTSGMWYGHWTCSRFMWRLIRGRRTYLLNRAPLSEHVEEMERAGFRVVLKKLSEASDPANRGLLAKEFGHLTDEDLSTSEAFLMAIRPRS